MDRVERDRRQRGASATGRNAATLTDLAHDVSLAVGVRPPAWLAAAREDLDDDHAGAAARAWAGSHARRVQRDIRLLLRVGGRWVGAEQRTGFCDVPGAAGVGEEP